VSKGVIGSDPQSGGCGVAAPKLVSCEEAMGYEAFIRLVSMSGYDPENITPKEFQKFLTTRAWAPQTKRLCLFALRDAQRRAHGKKFPLCRVKLPRPKARPMPTLTAEEKDKLIMSLDLSRKHHKQYLVAIMIFWDTWLRISELCGLRVADLDLDNGTLTALTKGGEWETKALTDGTIIWIRAWLIDRPIPSPTLFCNLRTGKPWTRDGLRANLARIGKKAGLKHRLTAHQFRRGGVTNAINKGMPTRLAQVQGGWKQLDMVHRYTQALSIQDVRRFLNDD